MVEMDSLLPAACVLCKVAAGSRKRVLDVAADAFMAAQPDISARALFSALVERERLGSTGLGAGVAIPHCRLDFPHMIGGLLTLAQPVDFDAPDGKPVDLLFILVAPQDENSAHLEALTELAAIFGDAEARARLRGAASAAELKRRFLAAAGGRP